MPFGGMGARFGRMGGLGSGPGDAAAGLVTSYGTPAILLSDLDPAKLTPSGLIASYQDVTGVTPLTTSGQTEALRLERSLGAARTTVLDDAFDYADQTALAVNWTVSEPGGATGVEVPGDGTVVVRDVGTADSYIGRQVTSGVGWHRVLIDLVAKDVLAAGNIRARLGAVVGLGSYGDLLFGGLTASAGTYQSIGYVYVSGANPWLSIHASGTDLGATIGGIRLERISGNHLYQTTAADEPTLVLENDIWRIRGDGLTKNFLTPLAPAASCTGIVAGEINAVSDTLFGASVGTAFFSLATGADGKLRGFIGTTAFDITAASIVDVPGVAGIRGSGTDYYGFWQPLTGGTPETVSGTFAGSIPTTQPIRWLAENDDGSRASPADADTPRGVVQQSAWTDAEIAAVANQYRAAMAGW